jgi:hypothetical protein
MRRVRMYSRIDHRDTERLNQAGARYRYCVILGFGRGGAACAFQLRVSSVLSAASVFSIL